MLNFPKFYSVILVCWAVAGKGLMGGLFFLGLFVFFPLQAFASPWVSPGDLLLRHDIQLLSDSGYLTSPSQSWPLPWADLRDVAAYSGQAESAGLEQALNRVRRRFRAASRLGLFQHGGADLNIHPQVFRDFSASPRESGEAFSAIHWLGWRFASQLQVEMVSGPDDGQRVRFDDSWVAATLGNWIVSFGAQDRWWGPGWDGSLILSTSARPVPALSFQRKQALPFNWPLLSFLGPWRLEGFVGQLEGDRAVSHAKLLGLRLSFKPWSDLEVGLSRTAQWGGNGRQENFTSLVNLILGRDNRGDSGINVNNEPGNQLGGVDWRLHTRLISSLDLAFYGQIVGEDEANGLPSRPIGLAGLEHAGTLASGGSYRIYLEWADTRVDFYKSKPFLNTAYEHSIYTTGYRFRGRPLGHTLDNDGFSTSLGALWVTPVGHLWRAHLLSARFNRDGTDRINGGNVLSPGEKVDLKRILVAWYRPWGRGNLTIQTGLAQWRTSAGRDYDLLASVGWEF